MSTPIETGLLYVAGEKAAVKAAESVANRALDAIIKFTSKKFGEKKVVLGTVFERYLENATNRYNRVRTLATGPDPRSIIGDDSIYVSIGVNYKGKEISTSSANNLLKISKDLLIIGTGGVGKSMLMRFLFLKSAEEQEYIPILLELRKIDRQTTGKYSIMDLVFSCLQEFDAEIPRDQFEYSLRLGKYLFLLDGFDEVKESAAAETAEAIQAFCAKYPKNPCIITSRPRQEVAPLETFTEVKSRPLSKQQAVELASKIWVEDEKTREFCLQLENELYDEHRDFAENPLLLSMMFLTFMRNSSIPNHLSDFYQKAYDALFSAHDGQDKGYYRRDFRCKTIDEGQFKLLFSYFCFHSYYAEVYEFSYEEILGYLNKGIEKLKLENVSAEDFLVDLRNVVCMIICDGDIYRFSHRSFQAYFAAYYTSRVLTDEQQKKLFRQKLSDDRVFIEDLDYYELLNEIEPERFKCNAMEEGLRELIACMDLADDSDIFLLKTMFAGVRYENRKRGHYLGFRYAGRRNESDFLGNVASLYRFFNKQDFNPCNKEYFSEVKKCMDVLLKSESINSHRSADALMLPFELIDRAEDISEQDKKSFYKALGKYLNTQSIKSSIEKWLLAVDKERNVLAKPNFIFEL